MAKKSGHRWSGAGYVCADCGCIKDTGTETKHCPGRFRLKRVRAGEYETADGLFNIWQAVESVGMRDEKFWYVNHKDFDETLVSGGLGTKWQAVEWLTKAYQDQEEWLFPKEGE